MTEDQQQLKDLAGGIILAQGNKFIKELLREKGIRIGATKEQFQKNMINAIEAGDLGLSDFEEWLDRVEGWGNQHVYLYKIPDDICNDPFWDDESKVKKKIEESELLSKYLDAQTTFDFPETLALTGIYYKNNILSATWHKGTSSWFRVPSKDKEKQEGLDLFKYKAHRKLDSRTVMRFEMRLKECIAAIFVPLPWNEADHNAALNQVEKVLDPIVSIDSLIRLNISRAIQGLDQAQLTDSKKQFKTQSSRLSAGGGYVEFASTTGQILPVNIRPIREVWLTVRPEEFTGTKGLYFFELMSVGDKLQKYKVQLHGVQRRIRFMMKMLSSEVWIILKIIREYGQNDA